MKARLAIAGVAAAVALLSGSIVAAIASVDGAATVDEKAVRLGPPDPVVPAGDLPDRALPVDTSRPDRTIGDGSPATCTSSAVVEAVAAGGIIAFDCGPDPVTIEMDDTAKIVNTSPVVVLDGGGLVTLDGGGRHRLVYMNTCDPAQIWTTPHCQNQDHPRLTIQGLTFANGDSTGDATEGGGGGAVFVRGGQLSVIDSHFSDNRCDSVGPDVGGAALRVLSQYEGRPVVVANSTFRNGICSNGSGISSIGVSWEIYRSTFENNRAIGNGANPARPATPGGGSGGAIYLDGNRFTLDLFDVTMLDNHANEGGGAIFFVSNDRSGELRIDGSRLERNPSLGFETNGYPGVFFLGAGVPQITDSVLR